MSPSLYQRHNAAQLCICYSDITGRVQFEFRWPDSGVPRFRVDVEKISAIYPTARNSMCFVLIGLDEGCFIVQEHIDTMHRRMMGVLAYMQRHRGIIEEGEAPILDSGIKPPGEKLGMPTMDGHTPFGAGKAWHSPQIVGLFRRPITRSRNGFPRGPYTP